MTCDFTFFSSISVISDFSLKERYCENLENVMLLVVYNCMLRPSDMNSFKWCLVYYICPPSSVPKEGNSPAQINRPCACICRLSVKSYRCSKTLHLYNRVENSLSRKCMLLLLRPQRIFIGGQFENHEVNSIEIDMETIIFCSKGIVRLNLKARLNTSKHTPDNFGQVRWSWSQYIHSNPLPAT